MEYLGLYDKNGIYTGEMIERSIKNRVPKDRYFRTVIIFIQNSKGKFLIQKVSKEKGDEYATTGGHVKDGNTSIETIIEEVWEELGILINKEELYLYRTEKHTHGFQDAYYTKKNIELSSFALQKEEVESVKWMTIDAIDELIQDGYFRLGNIASFLELIKDLEQNKIC